MRTREIHAGLMAAAITALLAGCGGSGKKPAATATAPSGDQGQAEAKLAVVNATAAVETCFTGVQDYTQCTSHAALGPTVKLGTGPGEVTVTSSSPTTAKIEAHSSGGGAFSVERTKGGAILRKCRGPGCPTGSW